MGKDFRQWKTGGFEDKFLENLIQQGTVTKSTKPIYLVTKYPTVFGGFSVNVVRNHLNTMKQMFGLNFAGESDSEGIDNEIDPFSTTTKEANIKSEPISPCASTSIVQVHIPIHGGSSFSHQNFPIVCSKFTDPDTEREKVLMVASMPGGSENIRIEISEDGRMVTVRYAWTRSMCDIRELFRHQLMKKDFTTYHPMVLSFKAQLLKAKSSIEAAPDAAIQVRLPIQIQKSLGSYQTWEIRQNDGSSVLMAEFTGLAGHTNEISYNIHQS